MAGLLEDPMLAAIDAWLLSNQPITSVPAAGAAAGDADWATMELLQLFDGMADVAGGMGMQQIHGYEATFVDQPLTLDPAAVSAPVQPRGRARQQYSVPKQSARPAGKIAFRKPTDGLTPRELQRRINNDVRQAQRRERIKLFVAEVAEATAGMGADDAWAALMGEQQLVWEHKYGGRAFGVDLYWHMQQNEVLWAKIKDKVQPDMLVKVAKKKSHISVKTNMSAKQHRG